MIAHSEDPILHSAESFWKYFIARNPHLHLEPALVEAVLRPACQTAFIAGWISCDCNAPLRFDPPPQPSNPERK